MTPPRWLTVKHAAEYLDFPSPRAFYIWARRNAIPFAHCGRGLRFLSTDLDKALVKKLAIGVLLLFSFMPSLHAQQAPSLALIAGSSFDLATTLYDMHAIPGGHEANPFLSHGGTVWLIAIKSGATALLVLSVNRLTHDGHPKLAQVIGWTGGILFSSIAVRNLRVGR